MKKIFALAGASLLALSSSQPVFADSPGEVEVLRQQVQELLKRIDKLEKKTEATQQAHDKNLKVTSGSKNVSLQISGQVNRKVMAVHDGNRSRVKHVDGGMSPTSFEFHAKAKLNQDTKVGAVWEVGVNENSSSSVAAGKSFSSTDSNNINNRHLYIYGESDRYGRLSMGHLGEATYGVMEDNDLSGTSLVLSGASHSDVAGGHRFFNSATNSHATGNDGEGISVEDVIDGFDGNRRDVIRYDTPIWQGLQASVSHSGRSADTNAFAIRYEGKIYGVKVATAAGYANVKGHMTDTAQVGTRKTAYNQYNGSIGVLLPCGLNFYLAGGRRDHSNAALKRGSMWSTKIGYRTNFFEWGETAFSLDYGEFNDLFATRNMPDDKFKAKAFGFALVQSIDQISTDVYFGVKRYVLDANTIEHAGSEVNAEYKGITAFLAGARLKF
tara:strand:- start:504 stop:1823 length:1320 start_codon:yes stop_codon:yes gene_type:complete